jgi:Family of unknown function (DUF6152)
MRTLVAAALAAALFAGAARAHHGVSTYRMDVVETLDGVVAGWTFGSPHTWLTLRVDGASWEIEGAPPRWMSGQGFAAESLAAGDRVTIVYHPHRSRAQAGILMEVRRADGTVLKVNRPASLGGP